MAFLGMHPIQKGLLFTLPKHHSSTSNLLHNLHRSLPIALLHFYPLAGRLETRRFDGEEACTVCIDCQNSPGVRLIHAAASGTTVSDVVSPIDVPELVNSLFDLGDKYINYDCCQTQRSLLSIQVTQLVDGVFLGFSMSHSVVDGTSFMHFLTVLDDIYNNIDNKKYVLPVSRLPIFNYKPWCDNNDDNNNNTVIKLPHRELDKVITRRYPEALRDRIFHFSSTSMARLKAQANAECTSHSISSFQALSALMWRSITKARNLDPDQQTSGCIIMNGRSRMDPPISDNFFGNFLGHAKTVCTVDELLGQDLGWAAMRLNETIGAQNGSSICSMYRLLADHFSKVGLSMEGGDFHGPNSVVIGGSARFEIYRPEFGLGKAVAARMGFGNKEDGKITANPGREGGGSVDLEVSLRPHSMAALEADQLFMSFVSLGN